MALVCRAWHRLASDARLLHTIVLSMEGRSNHDATFLPRLRSFNWWALTRAAPSLQHLSLQLLVPTCYSNPGHPSSMEGGEICAEVIGLLTGCGAAAAAAGGGGGRDGSSGGLQSVCLDIEQLPSLFRIGSWAAALGRHSLRSLDISVRYDHEFLDDADHYLAVAAPLHGLTALQHLRLESNTVGVLAPLPSSLTKLQLDMIAEVVLPPQVIITSQLWVAGQTLSCLREEPARHSPFARPN